MRFDIDSNNEIVLKEINDGKVKIKIQINDNLKAILEDIEPLLNEDDKKELYKKWLE